MILAAVTIIERNEDADSKNTMAAQAWMSKTLHYIGRGTEKAAEWLDNRIHTKAKAHHRKHTRAKSSNRKRLCMAAIFAMAANCSARQCAPFDSDSRMVGIDNRCSGCITHKREDIPGSITPCKRAIKGFGGTRTFNVWQCTIHWKWEDDQGEVHHMIIPNSYYVPEGGVRLLSPQHWAQTRNNVDKRGGAGETTTGTEVVLFWNNQKSRRTIPIESYGNNVATFSLASGYDKYHQYCKCAGTDDPEYDNNPLTENDVEVKPSIISDDEDGSENDDIEPENETPPPVWHSAIQPNEAEPTTADGEAPAPRTFDINAKDAATLEETPDIIPDEEERVPSAEAELLRYHYDFGHLPFPKLQQMAKDGQLPRRLAKCHVPVCSACGYAKATKRPWRSKTVRDREAEVKPTRPGQVVSVDQLVSPTPGLIAQMTGFLTKQRYNYATVYVDQATSLGFVYLQRTATAAETIQGKKAFERYALNRGVKIEAYHADNGIFKAKAWVQCCERDGQELTFAAVGAHHANGKAERRIRELQEMARTMLMHAHKRWPEAISAHLWPYALRQANLCINNAPNMQHSSKQAPIQLFAQTPVNINRKHWKPFGCPVYVLSEALQSGKPHHKWKERARIGIYLGQSPIHNRNVALVLHRHTGHVSPQFHVRFDKGFDTMKQEKVEANWQVSTFFKTATGKANGKKDQQPKPRKTAKRSRWQEGAAPGMELGTRETNTQHQQRKDYDPMQDGTLPQEGDLTMEQLENAQQTPATSQERREVQSQREQASAPPQTPTIRTRSGRIRKPTQRLIEVMSAETEDGETIPGEIFTYATLCPQDDMVAENGLLAYKTMIKHEAAKKRAKESKRRKKATKQQSKLNPIAFKAALSDPDTMYHHEAMAQEDSAQFVQGMQKEMDRQMEDGNFSIVHRSKIPKGTKIFKAVWQMKRKRDIITRDIKAHKARLNFDGSRMEKGRDYDQTYAPVANWASIRLVLALVSAFNWHTTQIDYVLAYPQAPVEREVYMEIPRGYELEGGKSKTDYALQLHANLYGQKQAGRVWYQHLSRRLVQDVGFTKSSIDECVFYRGSVVYVLYTDDSILCGPNQQEIDQVIADLKAAKLNITVEGNIKDFLGVNIAKHADGRITFAQPHLIQKILQALHFKDNTTTKDNPMASSKILHRHLDEPAFDESFNYRSIVGMLNYLEAGSRSDISYATHQCARFASNPRKPHGEAVRWIARYLKGTREQGMTFHPNPALGLEVYVDADFAGNWNKETASTDRDTARSRHGYIIRYMGCPVIWKSQLQTEIALSSTESEYTGLSYALRAAIPLMRLLEEMKAQQIQIHSTKAEVHCKVFEDNSGALEMARVYKFRPRTKHLNVKLHHFRSYVEEGKISIHAVDTTNQLADYLTKPLAVDVLRRLRKRVLGW